MIKAGYCESYSPDDLSILINPTIALLGDSWVNTPYRLHQPLKERLEFSSGIRSCGYISAAAITLPSGASRSRSGEWTDDRVTSMFGADGQIAKSTQNGSTITFTSDLAVDSWSISYVREPSGGTLDYVSGVTSSSISTIGSEALASISVNSADRTLTITAESGVTIAGVYPRSIKSGAVIHKLGNSGADAERIAKQLSSVFRNSISYLDINIAIISFGVNDKSYRTPIERYYENIEKIGDRIALTNPEVKIVLMGSGDSGNQKCIDNFSYNQAMKRLSMERGWIYISIADAIGGYTAANNAGYYEDIYHVNTLGGEVIADYVYPRLFTKSKC